VYETPTQLSAGVETLVRDRDRSRTMISSEVSFPDTTFLGKGTRSALILVIPLLYLAATLYNSSQMAVWGMQVDPESAYTMNGLVAAAGYGSMKFDHPGTTTTLMVEGIIRLWALIVRPSDIVEFGLQHYDSITYAARTCEALILTGVLVAGGLMVGGVTRSAIAAMLYQTGAFVHPDTFHFEMVLIPESLMVSCAMLGMAIVIRAALGKDPPSVRLGVASGLIFALGFSSKYLYLVHAVFGVSFLRNRRAALAAFAVGLFGFVLFNLAFNPGTITRGFGWLVKIATHQGYYGEGEAGFVDASQFWPNMASLIAAQPMVFAIFVTGALFALAHAVRFRNWSDPLGLTLLAAFAAFALQLVATSKHLALHYMMATWVLAGGVLVLLLVQARRLAPAIPPAALALASGAACLLMVSQTLTDVWRETVRWRALQEAGARLSRAVDAAGPACANVSTMYVRAPENNKNHGFDMTVEFWGDQAIRERFARAYEHAFSVPLLDQNIYTHVLKRNFRPIAYAQLAASSPCLIVRSNVTFDEASGNGLLALGPEHCEIEGVHVYTVGIACAKIRSAYLGSDRGSDQHPDK
jgi:hypothetical protein